MRKQLRCRLFVFTVLLSGPLAAGAEPAPPGGNEISDPQEQLKVLASAWIDYTRYVRLTAATFDACDLARVGTEDARRMNATFDSGLEKSFSHLETRILAIYLQIGVKNPSAFMYEKKYQLDKDSDEQIAKQFAGWSDIEKRRRCQEFVELLKTPDGSYRTRKGYAVLIRF